MRPTPWPALACLALVPALWAASLTDAGAAFDEEGSTVATGWPGSDHAWHEASWPGLSIVAAVVLGLSAVACVLLRDRRAALLSLVAELVLPAVSVLKDLFDRARPADALADGFSFPSGHATSAMVAYGIVAVLLVPAAVRRGAPRWLGPLAFGLWLGLALAVGVARVAAGVHWPLDVLAGWALGGAAVAAVWWAHSLPHKSKPGDPAEPTQPAL